MRERTDFGTAYSQETGELDKNVVKSMHEMGMEREHAETNKCKVGQTDSKSEKDSNRTSVGWQDKSLNQPRKYEKRRGG